MVYFRGFELEFLGIHFKMGSAEGISRGKG